jgi:hypothetical protein
LVLLWLEVSEELKFHSKFPSKYECECVGMLGCCCVSLPLLSTHVWPERSFCCQVVLVWPGHYQNVSHMFQCRIEKSEILERELSTFEVSWCDQVDVVTKLNYSCASNVVAS